MAKKATSAAQKARHARYLSEGRTLSNKIIRLERHCENFRRDCQAWAALQKAIKGLYTQRKAPRNKGITEKQVIYRDESGKTLMIPSGWSDRLQARKIVCGTHNYIAQPRKS